MVKIMRVLRIIFVVFFLLMFFVMLQKTRIFADDPTPTPTTTQDNSQQVDDLRNKIKDLQGKISGLQDQEKSLSSTISVMDNQIKLTEYKMDETKQEIVSLTDDIATAEKKITNLDSSLNDITKALISHVQETYQLGSVDPMQILLTSSNLTNFVTRLNYMKVMQDREKRLMYDTQQAKNDYANQKQIFEDKKAQVEALKKQLEDYTTQIDQQKAEKQKLLSETQGSEENYQQILAQTEAQLAGFSGFVSSQGGASILSNQTTCDDWGCYYNQRDAAWGNDLLNGIRYTLASDGCLVTSMAMVYTHYGHRDVTPQSINANSGNFGGIPAVLLKYSVTANGVSSQRVSADIDATLASGNPIIVGISYDGGSLPDHFVVFVSGSNGDYTMNDPFTPNGHNISFRGRYPSVRIVETDRVSM